MNLEQWVAKLETLDDELVTFLHSSQLTESQFAKLTFENPYRGEMQRCNLLHRLRVWQKIGDPFLFVGEAPGYKGCQICGIPFASEKVLLDQANDFALQNSSNKYWTIGQASEQSATIIWRAFRANQLNVATWNAYPFHPYNYAKGPTSNRTPHPLEVEFGKNILNELIQILKISSTNIYAVGRTAQRILELDDAHTIRHPANGGAKACSTKIAEIATNYRSADVII